MTLDTAIDRMLYRIKTASDIAGTGDDDTALEDMQIAVKAMQALKVIKSNNNEMYDAVVEVLNLESILKDFEWPEETFYIGDKFTTICIFSGAEHLHVIKEILPDKIICDSIHYEQDGTHNVTNEFPLLENENGKYIKTWEYQRAEGRVYPKDVTRN